MIQSWINAAQLDLKSIGIVNTDNPDDLIKTAIIQYTLSQLDVENSEMYFKAYSLLKDELRHTTEYITPSEVSA